MYDFHHNFIKKNVMLNSYLLTQSDKHKLGTYEIKKISLWCFNDKRFV